VHPRKHDSIYFIQRQKIGILFFVPRKEATDAVSLWERWGKHQIKRNFFK
jgi:hypothetical protein